MKFGLFYELQLPRPWEPESEARLFRNALDQVELADRLGFDALWEVEHHFLEEYSHSSAPEVFLAACSQRTKRIRLGHGVMLMSPRFNHPARSAERIATLDLVSGGRVDWGTGESATAVEMEGFGLAVEDKTAMWQEATEQAANMLTMTPYPGFQGTFFKMPCRNIVPKPVQRPHPPLWVACSRRETIHRAARHGIGALGFAFLEPEQAAKWVGEYYEIIKSTDCVPLGHAVNPNIALVCGMSCHHDEQEAIRRGFEGIQFFGYSLGYFGLYGEHVPGRSGVWDSFIQVKDELKNTAGRGCIGTPEQIRRYLREYEQAGVDQVIFIVQGGRNRHEHICESFELFAKDIMPEFRDREVKREIGKREELAPYVDAAMARKQPMPMPEDAALQPVIPFNRRRADVSAQKAAYYASRGGAISVPTYDPHANRKEV
jgi:alkanesulfonate monooxygenase SsuD/methylene tetrahydromethanopterin reductase-like flavin-dependent oxidoreductase (luciferase family)